MPGLEELRDSPFRALMKSFLKLRGGGVLGKGGFGRAEEGAGELEAELSFGGDCRPLRVGASHGVLFGSSVWALYVHRPV